jgi:MscS family membrane protein
MTRFDAWFRVVIVVLAATVVWSMWAAAQTVTNATVEFAVRRFSAGENAGVALITLRRNGPTNAAVSVVLTATPGTASPGEFVPPAEPITIPAGKRTQTVEIAIDDDLNEDGNKTIRLSLSEPSGGATLGANSMADLVIIDNDAKQAAWLTFGLDRVPWMRKTVLDIPLWQYTASLIYIFLAFYVSKLFDFWIRGWLKRWSTRTRTHYDDMLLQLLGGPIKVIAFVILLHLGLRIFMWPQWFADFLSKGLKIVVAVSLTYMALRFIDVATGYWKRRAVAEEDLSFSEQLLPIIRNTLKAFAIVVAVLLTLQNLGLNITSLITSLGIGGLALALAAQDTLSNFFGAVVILVDKPFRIGDTVRIDPHEGTVETIGFRSTRVRTADGHLVTIPNKTVGNAIVTNISRRPHIRTTMVFKIAFDTPSEKVKRAAEILNEVYRQDPGTKDVVVSLNKFLDGGLHLQVVHTWNGTDAKKNAALLQSLSLEVKERFEREGIRFV